MAVSAPYKEGMNQQDLNGPKLMTRRSVQLLADGESLDEVYLVTDKQLRANKNGNLYLQVELRDRTGTISARMWNATEHHFRGFEEGDFLRIKGKVQLFQGSLQVIFTQLERRSSAMYCPCFHFATMPSRSQSQAF